MKHAYGAAKERAANKYANEQAQDCRSPRARKLLEKQFLGEARLNLACYLLRSPQNNSKIHTRRADQTKVMIRNRSPIQQHPSHTDHVSLQLANSKTLFRARHVNDRIHILDDTYTQTQQVRNPWTGT